MNNARRVNVGVVGATGLVGTVLMKLLDQRNFAVDDLRVFASPRSAGDMLSWRDRILKIESAEDSDFAGLDIVLMSAGALVGHQLAPKIVDAGAVVIDNSSAWRLDRDVPLVVVEVNPSALVVRPRGIIANPNCTTMVAVPVLAPLQRTFGLQRVVASTYQAVSGAGLKGIGELAAQSAVTRDHIVDLAQDSSRLQAEVAEVFGAPIAHNVIPFAGALVDDETDEEHKFRNETRKILNLAKLSVQCTCVRVPVVTGHSLSMAITLQQEAALDDVRGVLARSVGVKLADVPTPLDATGTDVSLVGRLRQDLDDPCTVHLFVVGDNLRKGASLNAVQIAELLRDDLP